MTRNVLVTGGGTGIGRAVAAAFAADGDTVVITGRRPGPLHATATELGPRFGPWCVTAPTRRRSTRCAGSSPRGWTFFRDTLTDQRRESLIADTSTGRAGTPDDVAGTIHFLASPAARHITGQVIAVNGGARTTR